MNRIDSFALKRRLVQSRISGGEVMLDFSTNAFVVEFNKMNYAPRFRKIVRKYFGSDTLIIGTGSIITDSIENTEELQALDSFTNKAYSKRYGRSKDVCKPKLQNAYTIGVYVKCGSKRVLLASLSGQKGADSEIFQIYDMAPVLDPENIDKVGYINTLVFNPVFDYKYVLSPTDRAVVNLFLKFITNQLYAKLLECFTSDRVKAIYLITISKVLDFLSASGIVFERVPGVHLLQNEYTNYIFNSFQKYWQPELAKNTPQVLSFKGVLERMVQQNGEGRLEYDKETGQLWICS